MPIPLFYPFFMPLNSSKFGQKNSQFTYLQIPNTKFQGLRLGSNDGVDVNGTEFIWLLRSVRQCITHSMILCAFLSNF